MIQSANNTSMTTVADIDVDKIWIALGKWGSYQRRQIIAELVAIWSCSLHVLSIVFLGIFLLKFKAY